MDYKEKLKAIINNNKTPFVDIDTFLKYFPELKESEDEKIRKWIIDDIRYNINNEPLNNSEYKKKAERAIAWLEKQGEQKPSDIDNKFIRMRETKPKDISEFLDRLTTVEQEFLWEHIAKIRELDKDEQKPADIDLRSIVDKEANAIWKEINTGGSHSIIYSFNQFYGICMQIAEVVVCKTLLGVKRMKIDLKI